MHHPLHPRPTHCTHAVLACDSEKREPPRALVLARTARGSCAIAGVEECDALDALRGPTHDFERHASAHRMPGEAESRGCRREHSLGHRAEARVRAGFMDAAVGDRAQAVEHRLPDRAIADESRQQHERAAARRRCRREGLRCLAHGRDEPRATLQPPRAAAFTARAVREPKRGNTRRALPSKILARSSALSHSIGST